MTAFRRRWLSAGWTIFVMFVVVSSPHSMVHARGGAQSAAPSSWRSSVVPVAHCGPGERPESGLQGQTTLAERFRPQGSQVYNCNLQLVGQFAGDGATWSTVTFENCAYFSSDTGAGQRQYPGLSVLDATDPSKLRPVRTLTTPAMASPNESVEINAGRKLMAGIQALGGGAIPGPDLPVFEVYDISNCRQPVLKGSLKTPRGMAWHAAAFTQDGRTYYATAFGSRPPDQQGFVAIDVSDPTQPREILRWVAPQPDLAPHWFTVSEDGTRMYVGVARRPPEISRNGVAIFDISDIQARRPQPKVSVVSTLYWKEGSIGQVPISLKIKGKPYLIFMDYGGGTGGDQAAAASACAQGMPPYGFAHLIDISDERKPVTAANLLLQVHDPANCSKVLTDPASLRSGYSGMVCLPDDPHDASMIACAWKEAGLRVFDIRNPSRPVELAYYKSAGVRAKAPAGSYLTSTRQFPDANHTADWAIKPARFDRSKGEIWFMSQDNGFQIVRFTDQFKKAHADLFTRR